MPDLSQNSQANQKQNKKKKIPISNVLFVAPLTCGLAEKYVKVGCKTSISKMQVLKVS